MPADFRADHLHIDLSSTLHQVIRRARTKQYFHLLLHRRLDEILATTRPTQRVVLALDGPAPLAKLLEQRRRRRRESEKVQRNAAAAAEAAEAVAAAGEAAEGGAGGGLRGAAGPAPSSPPSKVVSTVEALALAQFRPPNPELSTLALTTGSILMLEVHSSLSAYICKKLADPATAHLSFELSDSTVKGEGELKILSRLLHPGHAGEEGPGACGGGDQQQRDETHLVLGADSDLILMALVAGQKGVYILPDLPDDGQHRHRRHHHPRSRDGSRWQPAPGFKRAAGAAALAGSSLDSVGGSVDTSSSETETDSDLSGPESEGEEEGASAAEEAAAALAAAAAAEPPPPPPALVFSRDAAERLWREQHLGGGGQGREVTGLALDLMLLAVMCSGDDYLPAIQGMQLSNKHRPGVWDLYTSMRQEPQWQGQTLVQRSCECRGGRGRGARDCPTVRLNAGMVCALLAEYHRQRFVFMEGPGAAAGAPGSASLAGGDPALASGGSSMLGGGGAAGLAGGGGGAVGATAVVWDEEGLAAAAALATSSAAGDEALGGGGGGRRRPNITLRGMEAHPEAYVQGLEWVLGMYCSGAIRDYRFAYDLAAPSLLQVVQLLQAQQEGQQQEQEQQQRQEQGGSGAGAGAGREAAAGEGQQGQQGKVSAAAAAKLGRRKMQPLLPAACAMALLPRGGRIHAATALRHLMDEGSELEEIYATCDTCGQLGQQLGSMAREVDGVRGELAAAQLDLAAAQAEAGAGRAGAAAAAAALQAQVERLEAEMARLKLLHSNLSRTQQEHLSEFHPYKPFPTDQLEAAVAAVPLADYPMRERKLAKFGREFVYSRRMGGEAEAEEEGSFAAEMGVGGGTWRRRQQGGRRREVAAAAASPASSDSLGSGASLDGNDAESEEEGEGAGSAVLLAKPVRLRGPQPRPLREPRAPWALQQPLQPWLEECMTFAAAYPRVADPFLIRRSSWGVQRDVLPLRPYMQPPRMQRNPDGSSSKPSAVLNPCQLLRWAPRRSGTTGGGVTRRQAKHHVLLQDQRAPVHTLVAPAGGRAPARALLQGCTRLLHRLPRVLRVL
ncbi:hypothetical protein CHLNCDRAFT_141768 [Chlorella variabilis]|uniref:Xrn1 N-terminal domain-containing protein n=1 Tax=Chlorella variabilis TaxID=554065 RepID=E1ZTK0_CHLVA|nr:hypothetical protein CHLNCDRAFT_141768 [Chlorella variabilis]EFN50853.1 hypothetical protein CHLNCDRAFT_141768 [Chlorella variabilis]|eukprot:XP_005842955.1 hypothetical protein CHLNCDRAFT_141768 [Chlorella variabilis]